ncbi:MAG TPA: glycosyltransferase [Bacteroidetes bacterium]|nr:glycosyltransferase [Bacteroidota bacterium]HEX04406.1 glycosyltransferase [Bacteroidota bacterium]
MKATTTGQLDQPLVSIALSARNAEDTLFLSLASIVSQTEQNWELLFYDDGSTDDTLSIVESFDDPRIRIHRGSRSRGLAVRLNQAIDQARGEYYARMDSDDISFPARIRKQIDFLNEHHEVDLLATGAIVIDSDNRPLGMFPQSGTSHEQICSRHLSGFYFPHPTWMGRTSWFRKYRYRESMQKSQDQDLLLRTYRESRFALLPEVLLGYRQDQLNLRKTLRSRRMFAGALKYAFLAHGEPLSALLAVAGQAAKGTVEIAATATGLSRLILRNRRRELPARMAASWEQCLQTIEANTRQHS